MKPFSDPLARFTPEEREDLERQQGAEQRILSALKRIERAQTELNEACSDLSSVLGMVRNWERCGKVANSVKAFWHRLNGDFQARRGEWRTDK